MGQFVTHALLCKEDPETQSVHVVAFEVQSTQLAAQSTQVLEPESS